MYTYIKYSFDEEIQVLTKIKKLFEIFHSNVKC